jgi:hypothetical protein
MSLENASLIVTPNAYKAGKLYSVTPEDGSGDFTASRATTATRVNENGLIESVAVDVPRIDYTNGNCPSILVEPQRTNVILQSENLIDTEWSSIDATVSSFSNIIGLPFFKIDNTSGNSSRLFQSNPTSPDQKYNLSFFVDTLNTTSDFVAFRVFDIELRVSFDINNKTISTNGGPLINSNVKDYGNNIYRVSFSFQSSSSVSGVILIYSANQGSGGLTTTIGESAILTGAQLEEGTEASSYIPTTTSAVTRNADVISKTGISSLIGQSEGTMFIEYTANHEGGNGERIYAIGDGTTDNRIVIFEGSNKIRVFASAGGANQLSYVTTIDFEGNHKVAVAYAANNAAIYVDGTQVNTDSSFVVPSVGNVYLGTPESGFGISIGGAIKQAALYKTRLTNDELATLTTL